MAVQVNYATVYLMMMVAALSWLIAARVSLEMPLRRLLGEISQAVVSALPARGLDEDFSYR